MANIPGLVEMRSVSKFGSSVVKLIFTDQTDIYWARQQVFERLEGVQADVPDGAGTPALGPVSTGLGEIYQYVIKPEDPSSPRYTLTEIRTIQDWYIRRKLLGMPGVADVSGSGGYSKEYQAKLKPDRMRALGVTADDLYAALSQGNGNTGDAYIAKDNKAVTIRGIGLVNNLDEIAQTVVRKNGNAPVLVRDVADVDMGHALRFGAAIVVIVILVLLGNWRASLLAGSVSPLAMLFAFIWMGQLGIVGNIMSLGAIDFGLLVDPAIIVVESAVLFLALALAKYREAKTRQTGTSTTLTYQDRQDVIISATSEVKRSVVFGGLIILIVYFPILTLEGVEGKMFSPMARTVGFAILGALLLSITYVPMMSALLLRPPKSAHDHGFSEKIVQFFYRGLQPVLTAALRARYVVIGVAVGILVLGFIGFGRIGGEFIPKLQEGDMVIDMDLPTGTTLTESIRLSQEFQGALLNEFPDEISSVVSKIGTLEIKVDPLPLESQELYLSLTPKENWKKATRRQEPAVKVNDFMAQHPGPVYATTQPIESRVNDMMNGARTDVVAQSYGDNLDTLVKKMRQVIGVVRTVPGAVDVKASKVFGLPQLNIKYDRHRLALHGLKVEQINRAIQMAFGGATAGVVYEGDKRFGPTRLPTCSSTIKTITPFHCANWPILRKTWVRRRSRTSI